MLALWIIYFFQCSLEDKPKVEEELKRADAVVVTYACDQPETLTRVQTFWLPEIRRLKVFNLFILLDIGNVL